METAEILKRLDAIQHEFLAFDPSPFSNGGYRETSMPPDVRIARAVYWIEYLKREIQADDDDDDDRSRRDSAADDPGCPPASAADRL